MWWITTRWWRESKGLRLVNYLTDRVVKSALGASMEAVRSALLADQPHQVQFGILSRTKHVQIECMCQPPN